MAGAGASSSAWISVSNALPLDVLKLSGPGDTLNFKDPQLRVAKIYAATTEEDLQAMQPGDRFVKAEDAALVQGINVIQGVELAAALNFMTRAEVYTKQEVQQLQEEMYAIIKEQNGIIAALDTRLKRLEGPGPGPSSSLIHHGS